jgi:hypothetical protein
MELWLKGLRAQLASLRPITVGRESATRNLPT